ncbi:MAG: Membrane-associated zinc metalloprotease [Candidatus Roizmanbacteria bacterium GW2011_GWC2_37_13]|uniref:Membrane-associated zinc metalloprotease n=1 Tax=Candidatus Roizmanbacteria bacterium GW2011_GWC2_37_13 TaxID=1618486 RepID=A0A0G0GDP3_9BACT|nr:MAG: Membrane-associated zinc metalloprotease [Candidatus Roizmanbacteria bacterium GW2011_GWC1_37_12]KKQ24160.1 MAG: Membrane-associated zinc metalloprotease [Candidatus Roizmanbacteria bacterium GW2011_GWC2_37_13]
MTFIVFILILAVLILIHEFGHFIAAKKNGVKVEEFGFGLPPRIFGIKKGETIYSLNLIPLGGFVKLFGEEYHEIKKKSSSERAFINKKPWQKTIIVVAGVIMNLILGVSIYYVILSANNFQSDPIPVFTNSGFRFGEKEKKVIIAGVNKNSPAEKSNIKPEDVVIRYRINNNNWVNINSSSEFINVVKDAENEEVSLDLLNNKNGERKTIRVQPIFNSDLNRYIIGVNLADVIILKYNTPTEKLFSGFLHSYNLIDYNLKVISSLFSSAIKEKRTETLTQAFSGPIGIFGIIEDTVRSSGKKLFTNLLNITGLLSLSLALMNILPFPALDGGRMVFVAYEWITGKRSNKNIEKYVNFIGFIILITFGILISINDIVKIYK